MAIKDKNDYNLDLINEFDKFMNTPIYTRWPDFTIPLQERQIPTFTDVGKYINTIKWKYINTKSNKLILNNKSKAKIKLLHLINPYPSKSIDSITTQEIAMATIEGAKVWSNYMRPNDFHIDVLAVIGKLNDNDNENDFPRIPMSFYHTLPLNRSILNDYKYKLTNTSNLRHLPYLSDILRQGLEYQHDYTHIIYTNSDINVMPHFYAVIYEKIKCQDSIFFINRVEIPDFVTSIQEFLLRIELNITNIFLNISKNLITLSDIDIAYEYTMWFAQKHPGYDCMVTPINKLNSIITSVGEVFIGFPPIGAVLVNAAKESDYKCLIYKEGLITFHIGTRNGNWESSELNEYLKLNMELSKYVVHDRPKLCSTKMIARSNKTKLSNIVFRSACYKHMYYYPPDYKNALILPNDFEMISKRLEHQKELRYKRIQEISDRKDKMDFNKYITDSKNNHSVIN